MLDIGGQGVWGEFINCQVYSWKKSKTISTICKTCRDRPKFNFVYSRTHASRRDHVFLLYVFPTICLSLIYYNRRRKSYLAYALPLSRTKSNNASYIPNNQVIKLVCYLILFVEFWSFFPCEFSLLFCISSQGSSICKWCQSQPPW